MTATTTTAFRAAYDKELGANRIEYLEHRPVLDEFKARAAAAP